MWPGSVKKQVSMAVTLGDSRTRLKEHSLVFAGPFEGRPYDCADFRAAFTTETTTPVGAHVLAFGPLMRNREWYYVSEGETVSH